jgi:hypothetical protein
MVGNVFMITEGLAFRFVQRRKRDKPMIDRL